MTNPRILVVDDEHDILTLLNEILKEEGYNVDTATNAEEARRLRDARRHDLVLLDIWLPDSDGVSLLREWSGRHNAPVIMISGHATIDVALEASRWGAVDVLEKPISLRRLLSSVRHALGSEIRVPSPPEPPPLLLDPAWGRSPPLLVLRRSLAALAERPVDTLLAGEFGSGREELARSLHARTRRPGPFVRCTPDDLADEDRFAAKVEAAAEGTLFVTRVEGLAPRAQERLRAWLETRTDESRASVLLVARGGPDLAHRVEHGEMDRALLETVARRSIAVPPVRLYRDDIPELVRVLAERLASSQGLAYRRFTVAALNLLRQQDWPGNLRQLRNVVETVLHESEQEDIEPGAVQAVLGRDPAAVRPPHTVLGDDWLRLPLREARERFERAYFEDLLRRCEGRIGRVAEESGMERTHLYRKLRSLGIPREPPGGEDG